MSRRTAFLFVALTVLVFSSCTDEGNSPMLVPTAPVARMDSPTDLVQERFPAMLTTLPATRLPEYGSERPPELGDQELV